MLDTIFNETCPNCGSDTGVFDGYQCIECAFKIGDEDLFPLIPLDCQSEVDKNSDLVCKITEKEQENHHIVLGEKVGNIKTLKKNLGFIWNGYNIVCNPFLEKSIIRIVRNKKRVHISNSEFLVLRKIITELGKNPQEYGIDGLKFFSS